MSKGPTPRHSRPTPRHSRKAAPVTIDLDATDVTPRDEVPNPATGNAAKPDEPKTASTAAGANEMDDELRQESQGSEAREQPAPDERADDAGIIPPHMQPSRSSSPLRSLIGGGVGGVAAFGILYALQTAGVVPVPGAQTGSELRSELAAVHVQVNDLTQRFAQLPTRDDAAFGKLTGRLAALEQVVGSASAGAPGAAIANLDKRVNALSEQVTAFEARSEAASKSAGLASQNGAEITSETAIKTIQAENNRITAELDSLRAQTSALEERQSELKTSLTEQIEKVEAQLEKPGRGVEMAQSIARSSLKAAIDRGAPFSTELGAYASVAPNEPVVADLRELAATGVPTTTDLAAAFPDIARTIIAAARPAEPAQGIFDRLVTSAQSMVSVRPVGDVEGNSVEAILARIEVRLNSGKLESALAEWRKLPTRARDAAGSFGTDLATRVHVEKLLAADSLSAPETEKAE